MKAIYPDVEYYHRIGNKCYFRNKERGIKFSFTMEADGFSKLKMNKNYAIKIEE